jgi:hypothetical protein
MSFFSVVLGGANSVSRSDDSMLLFPTTSCPVVWFWVGGVKKDDIWVSVLKSCSTTTQHTDKKENQIFFIYKEIQNGAVAKSYMTSGLLIYGEIFAHFLIY